MGNITIEWMYYNFNVSVWCISCFLKLNLYGIIYNLLKCHSVTNIYSLIYLPGNEEIEIFQHAICAQAITEENISKYLKKSYEIILYNQ